MKTKLTSTDDTKMIPPTPQLPADQPLAGAAAPGYYLYEDSGWRFLPQGEVIEEKECCIYVNGEELLSMAATPVQLDALALGFLMNEGIVKQPAEVVELAIKGDGTCVDVWLDHPVVLPTRKVLTSGCTGGVTFNELAAKLDPMESQVVTTLDELQEALRALYAAGHLYGITRGVHTSILWRDGAVLASGEDVGRHNTLDKLRGQCLQQGIDTHDSLLLSTGRISSEMLSKGVRMGCPIIASRTSATSMSVELARRWNVTLVGYFRGNVQNNRLGQTRFYSHPERILHEGLGTQQ
jgi:FdhD protein